MHFKKKPCYFEIQNLPKIKIKIMYLDYNTKCTITILRFILSTYNKCNFPMTPHVCLLVGW